MAVVDTIEIRCPACGASEDVDASVLIGSPSIVCHNCGETWPVMPRPRDRITPRRGALPRPAEGLLLHAEQRALVSYSSGPQDGWAAKVAGDVLPEPARRSRLPSTFAAVAAVLFLAAFFGGREAAVIAIPDLAGLYAGLGMPVNLAGIAVENVRAERLRAAGHDTVLVRGTLRNLKGEGRIVPALTARLYGKASSAIDSRPVAIRGRTIPPGATLDFSVEFAPAPAQASRAAIRLAERAASEPIKPRPPQT